MIKRIFIAAAVALIASPALAQSGGSLGTGSSGDRPLPSAGAMTGAGPLTTPGMPGGTGTGTGASTGTGTGTGTTASTAPGGGATASPAIGPAENNRSGSPRDAGSVGSTTGRGAGGGTGAAGAPSGGAAGGR